MIKFCQYSLRIRTGCETCDCAFKLKSREMKPTFTFKLGHSVLSSLVTVGKFDGLSPSLAVVIGGGRVLIHSPHKRDVARADEGDPVIRFLNFQKEITALAAGSIAGKEGGVVPDILFIGGATTLVAYDVERNADLFFCDVPDGANRIVVNPSSGLVMVGGNCSILGFNVEGQEKFWTVTADNVSALSMCDVNADGVTEVMAGSDDFEIRAFHGEDLIEEITEADKITHLHGVRDSIFAYGLNNGTVGVYDGTRRLWRIKGKNKVTALHSMDVDGDGQPEIIIGWSNGSFTIRREVNGALVYKDVFGSGAAVAGIESCDYRMNGKPALMLVSANGEVRGYNAQFESNAVSGGGGLASLAGSESGDAAAGSIGGAGGMGGLGGAGAVIGEYQSTMDGQPLSEDDQFLASLEARKVELLQELHALEKRNAKGGGDERRPVGGVALPHDTTLRFSLEASLQHNCIHVRIMANTDVLIVSTTVIDVDGAVLGAGKEVLTMEPSQPGDLNIVPLTPKHNQPGVLRCQSHVAARGHSTLLRVVETNIAVPRFASFKHLQDSSNLPDLSKCGVAFSLEQTAKRFAEWMDSSFLLLASVRRKDKVKGVFQSVIASRPVALMILAKEDESEVSDSQNLRVTLRCNDMTLAGELIQDIGRFFKLDHLDSSATFPQEMEDFRRVLKTVEVCNAARSHLTADMADESQRLKALVIKAEDARIKADIASVRRTYTDLFSMNSTLTAAYKTRADNHTMLVEALKTVNQTIQKAANLRLGPAKSRTVSACRAAVKANNLPELFRIIESGSGSQGSSSASK